MHTDGRVGHFATVVCRHDRLVDVMSIHAIATELWYGARVDIERPRRIKADHSLEPTGERKELSSRVLCEAFIFFARPWFRKVKKRDTKSIGTFANTTALMI